MLRSALLLALALFSPGLAHGQLPFGGIVNVANTPGDSRHPHIAVDQGGTLHVAWADDSGSPGSYRILYKRSFDRGATFTSAVQVSQGAGAGLRPRLALHGSAVHLVWMEDVSDTKDILFARSVNGGASFAPPVNVSRTAGQSLEGRIGVGPDGTIYVAWDEAIPGGGITLARSFDGGVSFEPPRLLFTTVMSRDCTVGQPTGACTPYPGLAVDPASGRVYLVWHDGPGTSFEVRFSRSLDGGTTFSAPRALSGGALHSHCAAIAVGPSGRILIAYEHRKQQDPHRHDSLFTHSLDGGASFTPPLNLSNGPSFAFSDYPWPAEAPNGLIVVGWEDNRAGGELDAVLAVSSDGGASFGPGQNLSDNATSTSTEVVTLFGPDGTLYAVWEDYANGQAEVFLRTAPGVGGGGGPAPGGKLLATGAGPGGAPHVRLFTVQNGVVRALGPGFLAYDASFTGGVEVAVTDLDGDGTPEIVTAPGPGGGPHVRIFRVNRLTGDAEPLGPGFFAYDPAFRGGVRVAAMDVDGDGRLEIVTAAGPGGGPHVRVFRIDPTTGNATPVGAGFFAYAPAFSGGVSVAPGAGFRIAPPPPAPPPPAPPVPPAPPAPPPPPGGGDDDGGRKKRKR